MQNAALVSRISGCYIPIPTLFHDDTLDVNLDGMRRHVEFLVKSGARDGQSVILVGGGAGEFHTLSVDERLRCAEAVVEAAAGKAGVVLGVQTTRQADLVTLAQGAERLGCVAVQASAPFYEIPTEDDVAEWLKAITDHARTNIVFYATPWTGFHTSLEMIGRLAETPGVIAVKWYSPDRHVFEKAMREYSAKIMFIDNSLQYVFSHAMGARGINLHVSNDWPQWGQELWKTLECRQYAEAQQEITRVVQPFYDLGEEVARFTGGEGHLDKLYLEYVGLAGGRCRPPTRDIRALYREKVFAMARNVGVPKIDGRIGSRENGER